MSPYMNISFLLQYYLQFWLSYQNHVNWDSYLCFALHLCLYQCNHQSELCVCLSFTCHSPIFLLLRLCSYICKCLKVLKKPPMTKYSVRCTWIFNHLYYLFIFTLLVVTGNQGTNWKHLRMWAQKAYTNILSPIIDGETIKNKNAHFS